MPELKHIKLQFSLKPLLSVFSHNKLPDRIILQNLFCFRYFCFIYRLLLSLSPMLFLLAHVDSRERVHRQRRGEARVLVRSGHRAAALLLLHRQAGQDVLLVLGGPVVCSQATFEKEKQVHVCTGVAQH